MEPETYTVAQLAGEVRELVARAWPAVWVVGEVQRPRWSRPGHLYLELVEKGEGEDLIGRLDAVLWRSHAARLQQALRGAGLELTEGSRIRCRGRLDFWPTGGRLQLVVDHVDLAFSEGELERRRRQTLEALERAGLLERQRGLAWPRLPLALGLVTSQGSAAYHDFLATLRDSGIHFRVEFVHAAVQGSGADREIAAALAWLGQRPLDAIAMVRGGGSRSDLAVFDLETVARAVAQCPVPVVTGLGHEIDLSIADRVAHRAATTPTAVAEVFVQQVEDSEASLRALLDRMLRRVERRLAGEHTRVERLGRDLRALGGRVRALDERLRRLRGDLLRAGRRRLGAAERQRQGLRGRLILRSGGAVARQAARRRRLAEAIRRSAGGRLAAAAARVAGWQEVVARLAPERTLARGFAVVRDTSGMAVREAAALTAGDGLEIEVYRGRLRARVEESSPLGAALQEETA